jgi:hypothetical protein
MGIKGGQKRAVRRRQRTLLSVWLRWWLWRRRAVSEAEDIAWDAAEDA